MTSVLAADAVEFSYGRTPVLDCVSFELAGGEFAALVGPNGSGKSTLVRILLGLTRPAGGSVRLFGVPPARLRERWRIGYVPQRPTVAPELPATVEEVVAAGRLSRRGWARRLREDDWASVEHALESVDLLHRRRDRLSQLSGGQQQRALIAKALASEPELLILDEPVAGVDAESQARFRDSLVHLARAHGATILLVSHELAAVASDLDRMLVLRRGKVVFDGPPADLTASGVSLGVHPHDLPVWLEGL